MSNVGIKPRSYRTSRRNRSMTHPFLSNMFLKDLSFNFHISPNLKSRLTEHASHTACALTVKALEKCISVFTAAGIFSELVNTERVLQVYSYLSGSRYIFKFIVRKLCKYLNEVVILNSPFVKSESGQIKCFQPCDVE